MNTSTNSKFTLLGLVILSIVIVVVIIVILFSTFSKQQQPPQNSLPTPTRVPNPQVSSSFNPSLITPLQQTIIGETTDEQVIQRIGVISQKIQGDTVIYKVKSKIPGFTDEVRTKGGKVIFESTSTEIASPPPTTITKIRQALGEPEKTIKQVGPVGWYTNAYLYTTKGLLIYANRYTGTVYEVQRFVPMSEPEYEKEYGRDFLQPAQSEPEYIGN